MQTDYCTRSRYETGRRHISTSRSTIALGLFKVGAGLRFDNTCTQRHTHTSYTDLQEDRGEI